MCGRYSLILVGHRLVERFGLDADQPVLQPRYNIAPAQDLPIVTMDQPRRLTTARWGLRPVWMADRPGDSLINARAETIATKPSFRDAAEHHRCLIPADGFYEWDHRQRVKAPYRFTRRDGGLFAFAGIFAPATTDHLPQYAIVTTAANPLVATIHDRMPVILDRADEARWLDPQLPLTQALACLRSLPSDKLRKQRVTTLVNNSRRDDPALVTPVGA